MHTCRVQMKSAAFYNPFGDGGSVFFQILTVSDLTLVRECFHIVIFIQWNVSEISSQICPYIVHILEPGDSHKSMSPEFCKGFVLDERSHTGKYKYHMKMPRSTGLRFSG